MSLDGVKGWLVRKLQCKRSPHAFCDHRRLTSPDVIIAGAGIIGSSIAWRLAQRRVLVTLFDVGEMGGEASTAGAGMLAPGGEITAASPLSDLCLQSLQLYPKFIEDLEADSGHKIDFVRNGAIEFAATPEEWQALQARAQLQRKLGIQSEAVALPRGLEHMAGALRFPADAAVDPRDVMTALRLACEKHSVKLREYVPVQELQTRQGRVDVITDRRVISAEVAVLAVGSWSSQVATIPPAARPECEPVRGHLVSFQMSPGRIQGIWRHGHTYLLQRSTGELIAGTSQERVGFDRTVDPATVADICQRATELLPELKGREPERAWIGFRPGIVGGEGPVLDRLPGSNIWRAYGHYRNGILLAPITAESISNQILAHLAASN
jgi:glycine oxidase